MAPRKPAAEVSAAPPAGVFRQDATPAQAVLAPRLSEHPLVAPTQPSNANSAAPVVHVTIGRVEIRAVATPAAPKRAAPPKPTLSLGDYLQRRNGGRA